MTLQISQFEQLKTYLIYDRKLAANKHNIDVYYSRFCILARYFEHRDFNRTNFVGFMGYLKEKGYSHNYINNFIKLAKHIDKFYKLNEIQDFTYFDKPRSNIECLTPEQIQGIIAVDYPYRREAAIKNQRYKALIMTMFLTGARISEVLNLTWEDLREGAVPFIVFNQTKTKELRFNPIPEALYALLVTLPHFGGFIFSNSAGHQITNESVSEDIKRRSRAIGITRLVNNHMIRHSFVNFMLRSGAPIDKVSKLMGHKSIETTNAHYIHHQLDELAETLLNHHPYFRKQQTLDILHRKFKHFIDSVIDAERFILHTEQHDDTIRLDIHELKHD